MTAVKLREWRVVKPVACPSGVAISTRLRTTPEDERVLDSVASLLGTLRRADLARVCHHIPLVRGRDGAARRQDRRDLINIRKRALTPKSSSRWANAIIAGNTAQYRLARDAQQRNIHRLRAAIATIEQRLVQPTADTLAPGQRGARRKTKLARGYSTQAERFAKQRRLQRLKAELARVTADRERHRVHVVEGGKGVARARHNLDAAKQLVPEWRERWGCARYRIEAVGSRDEPFGNLTLTVTPAGEVSLRLPKPLEYMANSPRGRYVVSDTAVFRYRADEWRAQITGGKSMSYAITRKPGRAGRYLTAVDLNDGHLAVRRLDSHGNPIGRPHRITFGLSGSSARRDAQVRHAITYLIHYSERHRITAVAVEDLNFAEARAVGRESMGRGARSKCFRKTVAGIPTAVFRNRLSAQTSRHRIDLYAVNPAYTSVWGDQHWRRPYQNVTRHEAAATVIGRRRPTGEYQEPPPARDAGDRIPPARPGKNAATGPGNRCPGTGLQRPARLVTVRRTSSGEALSGSWVLILAAIGEPATGENATSR